MTEEEAIQAYSEKFGNFPYFLVMGMPSENLISVIEECLKTGERLKPVPGIIY